MQQNGQRSTVTTRGPIAELLWGADIEWKESRYFVPDDELEKIMTHSNVREELKRMQMDATEISHYAGRICPSTRRLFAAILYSHRGGRCDDIYNLLGRENITDEDLPLVRVHHRKDDEHRRHWNLARKEHYQCKRVDHSSCSIVNTISQWPREYIVDIERVQWFFRAPVFEFNLKDVQHYEFHDSEVLPFIEDEENETTRHGGYSEVWKIKIHPAHQKVLPYPSFREPPRLLAVKKLDARSPSEDRENFKQESKMHSRLNMVEQPHLVKLLASYKLKGRYHFLFSYAPANLRTHWDYIDMPYWNRETYLWFLNQTSGLISALRDIHDFRTGDTRLGPQQGDGRTTRFTGRASANLDVDPTEQLFGRHGDLKPENILWTNEGPGGILQITDLGLGRFHRMESRSREDWKTVNGSATYMPPEISLEIPVSRAYDIWSMGCVILEFISWLLEGSKATYTFSSYRMEPTSENSAVEDDTYYSIEKMPNGKKNAVVREKVHAWIERLRSNQRCSPMVRDLLKIIREKMIVVAVSERITAAGTATAEGLDHKMKRILREAEVDVDYLLGKNAPSSERYSGIKGPSKLTHEPMPVPRSHGVQLQLNSNPVNGS